MGCHGTGPSDRLQGNSKNNAIRTRSEGSSLETVSLPSSGESNPAEDKVLGTGGSPTSPGVFYRHGLRDPEGTFEITLFLGARRLTNDPCQGLGWSGGGPGAGSDFKHPTQPAASQMIPPIPGYSCS